MKKTLAQSLITKKRLAQKISDVGSDIQAYNSTAADQDREVDVRELDTEKTKLINEMIELKLKIFEATAPIRRQILEIGELKAEISFLKNLDTKRGKRREGSAFREGAVVEYDAIITKAEVDSRTSELQKKIDLTQQKIDNHNRETEINVETDL